MNDKHIGIISQVRMTSSRLPGKVLKKCGGKPLLYYHVERLKRSEIPVYIATTTNTSDDPIVEFCQEHNVPYFRGNEDNVLSRYLGLAEQYQLNHIIRVTSDCPLIDGDLIRKGLTQYLQNSLDLKTYLTNCQQRTFPRGFDFEIFSYETLKEMFNNATQLYEFEHVTPYIWKTHPDKFRLIHFQQKDDSSRFRITVDEPADLELIQILIEQYKAHHLNADQITDILYKNPHLSFINAHVEQKKV